jgi:hypothetical protein
MKNLSILAICLLVYATGGFAQQRSRVAVEDERNFRFGFKAGVNANKLNGRSFQAGFRYNYQLGGFLQFNFSERFGLQPEVNWVQTSSEFTDDATTVFDDLFRDGSQKKAKLSYLEIPVLLNINIGESKKIKAQVGPAYGILINENVQDLINPQPLYRNNEWSGIVGFWMQLPAVNIGVRYKAGLSPVNAIGTNEQWRSQAIQLFAGITF